MVNKTTSTPVKQSASSLNTLRGGFEETHSSLDIDTYDISDYMIATLRGEEYVAPAETTENAASKELRAHLGQLANTEVAKGSAVFYDPVRRKANEDKLNARLEKHTIDPEDPRLTKVKKKMSRAAILGTTGAGLLAIGVTSWYMTKGFESTMAVAAVSDAMDAASPYEIDFMYQSSMYVVGGAGQGAAPPIPEMQQKGYANGVKVVGVNYSAEIGPFVGDDRMDTSLQGGANDMYSKAKADIAAGRPVELVGYSEGTGVVLETANRLRAENGGQLPPNVHLTLIGGPYQQGGAFDSPIVGALSPMLGAMGIDTEKSVPPGTRVVYYDSDFWANSGNQVPTSQLEMLIELGFGGHEMPDMNGVPAHRFVDSDGVEHWVYTRDTFIVRELEKSGIDVVNTEAANRAFRLVFPVDGSKPNIEAARNELINALNSQPDPGSQILADIVKNLPPEYTKFAQGAMDGFNDIAEGTAKMGAGDVLGGWQQIQRGLNAISGSMPQQGNESATIKQWISGSASDSVYRYTGMDFSREITSVVDQVGTEMENQARAYAAANTANMNANASANPAASAATAFNTAPASTPAISLPPSLHEAINPFTNIIPSQIPVELPTAAPIQLDSSQVAAAFNNVPVPTVSPEVSVTMTAPTTAPEINLPTITTPAEAPVQVMVDTPAISIPDLTPTYDAPAPEYIPEPVYDAPAPAYIPPAPAPAPLPELPPEPVAPPPIQMPSLPNVPDFITNIFQPPAAAPAPSFDITPAPAPVTAPDSSPEMAPPPALANPFNIFG